MEVAENKKKNVRFTFLFSLSYFFVVSFLFSFFLLLPRSVIVNQETVTVI